MVKLERLLEVDTIRVLERAKKTPQTPSVETQIGDCEISGQSSYSLEAIDAQSATVVELESLKVLQQNAASSSRDALRSASNGGPQYV